MLDMISMISPKQIASLPKPGYVLGNDPLYSCLITVVPHVRHSHANPIVVPQRRPMQSMRDLDTIHCRAAC